jgi:hypothetical protein
VNWVIFGQGMWADEQKFHEAEEGRQVVGVEPDVAGAGRH